MTSHHLTVHHIHFVGIGGIGMSGIAEVLHNLGYMVTGSDCAENAQTKRLRSMGISVMIGHTVHHGHSANSAHVVVASSAIAPDNPEILLAHAARIPVIQRADMLAELMRFKRSVAISGTHGKTTTTSLMAALFDAAQLDPTVVNGGVINAYGTNARLGQGEWIVVEADESDGSFMRLPATIAVVTNIDPEHMSFYKTFDNVKKSFTTFLSQIPFYGLGILCIDHPTVREIAERLTDRRFVTYGFAEDADIRALNLRPTPQGTYFDVCFSRDSQHLMSNLFLPMMGSHNVQNALTLIAVAQELGISDEIVRKALSTFGGVKRRFTLVDKVAGISIIDDYAHHPVEIKTVIAAAKQATSGRVIAIFQPHRYSRLQELYDDFCNCFKGVDALLLAPVYAAGEEPIPGVDSAWLAHGIQKSGLSNVIEIDGPEELPEKLQRLIQLNTLPGDLILCMGAGSISQWAAHLPDQLRKYDNA